MAKYEQTILSGVCMLTITEITFDEMFDKTNNPLGRIDRNKDLREFFEHYLSVACGVSTSNWGESSTWTRKSTCLN